MNIKVRYIYTVIREDDIDNLDLDDDIQFFKGAMSDETSEYLYSGSGLKETVSIKMEISNDNGNTWIEIHRSA